MPQPGHFMFSARLCRFVGVASVLALVLSVSLAASPTALPEPVDVPAPPPGVESPGASGLPRLNGEAGEDAPAIGAISEVTYPGETLVVTGAGLERAELDVWLNGIQLRLTPLKRRENRLYAAVPQQHDKEPLPAATMLVWPVDEGTGRCGTPIRVNGATAWWVWPRRCLKGQDAAVRLFGKNLSLPGAKPRVVLRSSEGKTHLLPVVDVNPYQLAAELPEDLPAGEYTVWAHNGTGGCFGWSQPRTFEVVDPVAVPETVVKVDDFDPPRFHMEQPWDAAPAIQKAIDRCADLGGGTVQFGPRSYALWRALSLPEDVPIVLQGAGMGGWDFGRHEPTGEATWLVVPPRVSLLKVDCLISMPAAGSRIEDMTVAMFAGTPHPRTRDAKGVFHIVGLGGQDQQMHRVRLFPLMSHQQGAWLRYAGSSNQRVTDCEFICGSRYGVHLLPGVDDVRVAGCRFFGYIRSGRGTAADAICSHGGNRLIVEDCRFESVDRDDGQILSRSVLMYRNGMQHSYLANNVSVNCGAHPSVPGISRNVSEHYLFHTSRRCGGIIDVVAASSETITVDPESLVPSFVNAGGATQILPEGDALNGDWVVAITRGRGVGQWRVITHVDGGVWRLDCPWRIVPDAGAKATFQPMFRQHIVYNNYIDTAEADPALFVEDYKSTGVYLYHNCIDNIVAGNRLKNLGQGLALAATFDSLTAWNLFRDNQMHSIHGCSGGTSKVPTFYIDQMRLPPPPRGVPAVWYTIGNICRGNSGEGAEMIGSIGWRNLPANPTRYQADGEAGQVMSVVENNTFMDAEQPLVINEPANWTLIRNNRFELSGGGPTVEIRNQSTVLETIILPPNQSK